MNRVMLVGRLTSKPELRYTSANVAFTRITVAVNRTYSNAQGEREADFIGVITWRKQAENVCNYLDKGSLVSVEGRIQTGSFTDKDGSRRYTTDIVADSVQFIGSRSNNNNSNQNTMMPNYEPTPSYGNNDVSPYDYQNTNNVDIANDPFADFGDTVSIDDNFLD